MMRVFLIRHGETEHNKEDSITGQMDISLNDAGVEQARLLAERLSDTDFAEAYSSDLERTFETTRIVAENHELSPESSEAFREMDFGVFEGEHKSAWGNLVADSDLARHLVRPEEGETIEEVGERFIGKLEELEEKHREETVLVGGHSVALKASIMNILGLEGEDYRKLDLGNTSITVIEYEKDSGWKLERLNDTAHLE